MVSYVLAVAAAGVHGVGAECASPRAVGVDVGGVAVAVDARRAGELAVPVGGVVGGHGGGNGEADDGGEEEGDL